MPPSERRLGVFTTDADLIVQTWDDWMAWATGIAAAEARGRPLSALIPELEPRGLGERFRRVLADGVVEVLSPVFHRYLIPCPPQMPSVHFERMQQHVTIAPLRLEERIVGVLVTVEDATAILEEERGRTSRTPGLDEVGRAGAVESMGGKPGEGAALTGALGDPSWRVRRAAVDGLTRHGGPEVVTALLQSLRDGYQDLGILNSALQVLAMSDLDVVGPLVALLEGPDEDLRIYAAQALSHQRAPAVVPALLRALQDPNANVRYHAIEALGQQRAAEAVEPLLAVAETRDFFLAFPALDALAAIGDPAAAPRLVSLLEDALLRAPAADALGRLGDDEMVAPLTTQLNRTSAATRVAAGALVQLHDRYERLYGEGDHIADLVRGGVDPAGVQRLIDAVEGAGGEELRALAVVLGWLTGPAVERALTRLLGEPDARREVVEALVRHGSRVTGHLVAQLAAEDLETRRAAVMALGRIGDRQTVPALIALLGQEDELAMVTTGALAKIGDRRAFEPLLPLLGHASAAIRQAAVAAINSLGHPEMPARVAGLLADPDPTVRESAVRIAGYFGSPECLEPLLACCRDVVEVVRRTAVEHLPYLDDPRALPLILEALACDLPQVRAAAARALGHVEMAVALAPLCRALDDPAAWVRYAAARALGRHRCPESLEPLAALVQADPASQVRAAALEALGRIGGARAVAVVAPLAESPEPDLARAAIGALGLIGHPNALPPLLAALRVAEPARRLDAIQALAERGGAGVAGALQWTAAVDGDPQAIQAAVEALARMGTPEAIAALVALSADPARREAAVSALAQAGEGALGGLARGLDHPQAAVRRSVVDALTRMKRPRASDLLFDALDDSDPSVRLQTLSALVRLGTRRADRRLASLAHDDPDPAVRRAAERLLHR